MKLEKVRKTRKTLSKIASIGLPAFLFFIVLLEVIFKATGEPFYFFGTRYDVVLTDSMSVKNEEHADFLEGHDDQIQAFDLVVSKKIKDDTKLNVYDIVIFDNPSIGTDMHRIVDIDEVGEAVTLKNLAKQTVYGNEAIFFGVGSSIVWKDAFIFTTFELITVSDNPYNDDFYLNVNSAAVVPTVTSVLTDGHYVNTITYTRDSESPASFSITKKSYDEGQYIQSLSLDAAKGDILLTPSSLDGNAEQKIVYNPMQKYLIRGDKAKTDDGWYARGDLLSKVIRVHPKLGYVTRFLSSGYGAIMLVGIALLIVLYLWYRDREKNKKKEAEHEKVSE